MEILLQFRTTRRIHPEIHFGDMGEYEMQNASPSESPSQRHTHLHVNAYFHISNRIYSGTSYLRATGADDDGAAGAATGDGIRLWIP